MLNRWIFFKKKNLYAIGLIRANREKSDFYLRGNLLLGMFIHTLVVNKGRKNAPA